jgi:hypothetical protein
VVAGRLGAQRLFVSVNGQEVGRFSVSRRTERACRIPWHVMAERSDLEVVIEAPDAARPADFGEADRRQLGVALSRLDLSASPHDAVVPDALASAGRAVPVDVGLLMQADRMPLQAMMLNFESLGQNCEFGLVQRQCGAEPLGLLRFSSTPLPKLLDALDARFVGMGEAESVGVELSSNGREYMISDRRFGFLYHAFVDAGAMSDEALHEREVRRVPFLARKLVEDLEAAEKIFVFKGMGAMDEEEVYPLALALRRYGKNTLLFVNLADGARRGGSVEARAPGFLVGYLDRFAPGEDAADLELSQWVHVCRAAYRLRLVAGGGS